MPYFRDDIAEVVNKFETKHDQNARYASFDYSYNYFHPSNDNDLMDDMEKSCLSLGFYLASWGMFRGSSFMLEKSSKNFIPVIEYIAAQPKSSWEIDAHNFTDENIDRLISQYNHIKEAIISGNNAHLTLVTKIMLGVFSSVPAFDRFFIKSFGSIFNGNCGFTSFNKNALNCIGEFYTANSIEIESISNASNTICFNSGTPTDLKYSNSKVIDMYGFTKGL